MQNKISRVISLIAVLAIMFALAPGGVRQAQAAAPLLEENFDYGGTAGNLTTTTANWAAHSAGGTNPIQYVTSGLSMPSYASSGVGGAVTFTTSGEDDNRTFASQSSGPLYLAALVNLSSGQATGDYFLHFKNSGTGFAGRVFARNSSGNLQFGVGTSSTPVWSTTNFSFNTTYLVVAKHNMTTGVSDIYVLTSCESTEPVTPLATATGTAVTPIVGVAIRQGSSSNAPAGTIDGIRVAANWTDAVMCVAAPTPNLSVNDVTLAEGNSGTTTFTFTVALSSPAPAGGVTFDIATADNSATDADNDYEINTLTGQTIAAGNSTYNFNVTVNGDTTGESNETFYVNVTNVTGTGVTVSDSQGLGTITNDDVSTTKIHDVQGSGSVSPVSGSTVTVEAIVVGDYQEQGLNRILGFYVQEETADADTNTATSEGLFIYCNTCPTVVSVGDKVQVTGVVSEFNGMTEITATTGGSVVVVSTGNPLPTAASITLPVPGVPTGDLAAATTVINAYYEQFEGMLANFPDMLYVSEYFELARYGQVELTQGGRMHTFTGVTTPSQSGYINHQIAMATRMIILDDMDNRQNRAIDVPNSAYFYPTTGFSTSNYFRGGDTITGLTGVLDWYASAWRIRPVNGYSYTFTPANLRPAVPAVTGRLKVASFNVLNYFLTLDTTSSTSSGPCGPLFTADCRGADNATELSRQRTKMLAALTAINADVFGFMEMENTTGVEPLADIVANLPGYDYIDTGVVGNDTIRVGIIYKTATVVPVGSYAILDSSVNPLFDDSRNRPALAQTFQEISTGKRFTVVVNHFKSKGSSCGAGDDDTTTGQGNCNLTRTNAANALASWLLTDPTGSGDPDFLIIGDLNSYAMEDPITALKNAGYTDLVNLFGGVSAYGYVFDGQLGYLDHALSNASLTPQIAGVAEWHINADENPLLDYNDDVKDTGEATYEEESDVLPLYEPNEFRTSDHDPVIISLNLNTTVTFMGNGANGGSTASQTASGSHALTLNGYTRTGYSFAGWGTVPGGPVVYADGAAYNFAADITLYAQWVALPAPFNKTSLANWTYGASATPTLTWNSTVGAVDYEYCVSTVNGSCSTSWVSTMGATSANPAGLAINTTYYWQVRAKNSADGFTYANAGNWHAFVTQSAPFNKTSPANWTSGLSVTPTLTWNPSTGATDYEYCVSTVNGSCSTSWISTSGATSANPGGLSLGTTYYWQVRAAANGAYAYANAGNWHAFVTQSAPFNKTSPTNWTYGVSATPTLTWKPSAGAVNYEYCVSTTNGSCSTSWIGTSGATSANPAGLSLNTTYYWQVRSINGAGNYSYANANGWWAFITQAAPFNKTSPTNWKYGVSATPTLTWNPSAGATDYEYCVSAVSGSCSTSWISTSGATSANPAGLVDNATYFWQVRAVANGAYTYANIGNWFAFVTKPAPFNKLSPSSWLTGVSLTPTLSWNASAGATGYEYCISLTAGGCTTWIPVGNVTSILISTPLTPNTTYYWQVRAVNGTSFTLAGGGVWAFVTAP